MSPLKAHRVRLFLTCWILFSAHFATNVVREHYPALALIEKGSFQVDEYLGYHSDIFRHTDGHSYIGNNVLGSVIAAAVLLPFKPVLHWIERKTKEARAGKPVDTTYQTKYPNRQEMFRRAKQDGKDLYLGAATVITSVFLMAPLSALTVLLLLQVLLVRGVAPGRATWLALLFGFATPLFFRTAHLCHNNFVMQACFLSWYLLWPKGGEALPLSWSRRAWAGLLGGAAFALDYAGAIPCAVLWCYLVGVRVPSGGWKRALMESWPYALLCVPPALFLLWSQWAMYGDPWKPGQFVMPPVNFTDRGLRGMSFEGAPGIFWDNLMHPGWGLIPFGPILLLGFLPARYRELVVPRRERWFFVAFNLSFMAFCAINQYSLMQFNCGFRYLLPCLPFLFLAACDHLARLPRQALLLVSVVALLHSEVLSMVRETSHDAVPGSWQRILAEGPQLPWLTVLRQTSPQWEHILGSPLAPLGVLALCGVVIWYGSGRIRPVLR
jgi:hypothetical protein